MDGLRVLLGPLLSIPTLFSILTGLVTVTVVCIITRFSTGSRLKQESADPGPKPVGILPYWVPWLGHTLPFMFGGQALLHQCSHNRKQAAFAIILWGKKYTILNAPSLVKQMEDAKVLEPSTDARRHKLRYFFGNRDNSSGSNETLDGHIDDSLILKGKHGVPRTDEHVNKLARALERTVYNLISFNESWIDQSNWEKTGKAVVSDSSAEVSFFPLIEAFIEELATTVMMGRSFLENNPDFLEDVRLWNSKGTSFMNQVPLFLPQMSAAAAARERVLRSIKRFRSVLSAYTAGDDTGSDCDLSDVSPLLIERMKYRKTQSTSFTEGPDVSIDAAFLWASNKPNKIIAWLLYRVYSDPTLLAEVRNDIATFVQVKQVKSELPIPEPPGVTIDTEGLKKSKLLQEAMSETLRLHTSTITCAVVTKDIIVTETPEDVAVVGKDKPEAYMLRKGELVCLPHQAQQTKKGLRDGPGTFDSTIFSSSANLKVLAASDISTVQSSHVFGVRDAICPGKNIAEQEIMIVAAAILSMWEVEGDLMWPGQKPGLCSMLPVKDIRVKVSRRLQYKYYAE